MMNPAELANIAQCEKEFWWYRGMEEILYRLLDPIVKPRAQAKSVLEAGCGTGYMSERLGKRYGWRMFPTDLEREALLYCRKQGVLRTAQAEIGNLPFATGRFDAVVTFDVMVYVPHGDESRVVGELARVLAPGGLLVLRTAALELLRSRHAAFTGEVQRYHRSQLLKLAADNGINVLRCTYANSLLMPVALAKFRLIEPLTGGESSSGVHPIVPWLNRLLHGALEREASWLGAGHDLPIGQSLILIGEKIA
jgi:SAM-dependent methyltransferase